MPEYRRWVAAFRGIANGALTAAVPHGCTQGTRPASSSAMSLSVISVQRLARSTPGFSAADRPTRRATPDESARSRHAISRSAVRRRARGPTDLDRLHRTGLLRYSPSASHPRPRQKSLIFIDRPSMVAASRIKGATMATQMTKSQLIEQIATNNELAKKDVKGVIETLAEIGYKEVKKNGEFLVPGFAKFLVIKKPATKARKGANPFTGEAMTFKAKPVRKIVRARPVKAAKDAV